MKKLSGQPASVSCDGNKLFASRLMVGQKTARFIIGKLESRKKERRQAKCPSVSYDSYIVGTWKASFMGGLFLENEEI